MFTVELRINGTLISHIYGRNAGGSAAQGTYQYELIEVETHKVVTGQITHARKDGLRKLVQLILEDVDHKCSSAES